MSRKSAAKISRHKKKYWRKGVDVTDVTSYLDQQRVQDLVDSSWQEVTGGGKESFVIDKKPNSKLRVARSRPKPPVEQIKETSKTVRKQVDRIVKNRKKCRRSKMNLKKLKNCAYTPPSFYDLWDGTASQLKNAILMVDSDVDDACATLAPKKKGPKVPKTLKVVHSTRQHVDMPHPGISYNPIISEHCKLIAEAYETEVKRLDAEEGVRLALQPPEHESVGTMQTYRKEMLQGLQVGEDDDDDQPWSESDDVDIPRGKPTVCKLKPKAQRRREARDKKRQLLAAEKKKKRIADNEIFRLKSIKREIRELDQRIECNKRRRHQHKRQRLNEAARLGPHKFQPTDVELLLPEHLPGSMRLLKNQGNLIMDRCNSFEQRNVIEPRYRVFRKKGKTRIKEKEVARRVGVDYVPDNPFGL